MGAGAGVKKDLTRNRGMSVVDVDAFFNDTEATRDTSSKVEKMQALLQRPKRLSKVRREDARFASFRIPEKAGEIPRKTVSFRTLPARKRGESILKKPRSSNRSSHHGRSRAVSRAENWDVRVFDTTPKISHKQKKDHPLFRFRKSVTPRMSNTVRTELRSLQQLKRVSMPAKPRANHGRRRSSLWEPDAGLYSPELEKKVRDRKDSVVHL